MSIIDPFGESPRCQGNWLRSAGQIQAATMRLACNSNAIKYAQYIFIAQRFAAVTCDAEINSRAIRLSIPRYE